MFDFNEIKLDDEAKQAALDALKEDETFTSYLSQAAQNRIEAATAAERAKLKEFRENNIQLKQQLESFNGVDPSEYKRLKSLGGDGDKLGKLEEQFNLQLQSKQTELEQLRSQLSERESALKETAFNSQVMSAIDEYNSTSGARKLLNESGANEILLDKIKKSSKEVDGKLVLLDNNGNEFITDSGIGTISQWIAKVAATKYPFLFNSPSGSGATGSNSGGAGSKTISRIEFDAIKDPAKRLEVAKTHKII
jgi:hypothetical protein